MSDVVSTPKVRCDNCGHTVDKERSAFNDWRKPFGWGSVKMHELSSRYPANVNMTDLCEPCWTAAYRAVTAALRERRDAGASS